MNKGELLLNHYEHFLGNYIGADVYSNGQQKIQMNVLKYLQTRFFIFYQIEWGLEKGFSLKAQKT